MAVQAAVTPWDSSVRDTIFGLGKPKVCCQSFLSRHVYIRPTQSQPLVRLCVLACTKHITAGDREHGTAL